MNNLKNIIKQVLSENNVDNEWSAILMDLDTISGSRDLSNVISIALEDSNITINDKLVVLREVLKRAKSYYGNDFNKFTKKFYNSTLNEVSIKKNLISPQLKKRRKQLSGRELAVFDLAVHWSQDGYQRQLQNSETNDDAFYVVQQRMSIYGDYDDVEIIRDYLDLFGANATRDILIDWY